MSRYTLETKPSLRANGMMMLDMRITFAVSLDEIAFVIRNEFDNNPNLNKATVLNAVAEALHANGFSYGAWDNDDDEKIEAGEKIAKKLFPELIVKGK